MLCAALKVLVRLTLAIVLSSKVGVTRSCAGLRSRIRPRLPEPKSPLLALLQPKARLKGPKNKTQLHVFRSWHVLFYVYPLAIIINDLLKRLSISCLKFQQVNHFLMNAHHNP